MCVIAHQPAGAHITKEEATQMWQTNPDGGGFAYVDDANTVQVVKAMNFPAFWSEFEQARSAFPQRDFLLHMRIATHGKISLDNVHPFPAGKNTVMAHNGILHMVAADLPADNSVSDTRYFIENVLAEMPDDWLEKPYLVDMVEEYIGWSRLMFLSPTGVVKLGDFETIDKCFYSNSNHLPKKSYTAKPYKGSGFKQTPSFQNNYGQNNGLYGWDDWEDERQFPGTDHGGGNSAYNEWAQAKRNEKATEASELVNFWEFEVMLKDMKTLRAGMGLLKPILVIDEADLQVECTACLMEIDIETGQCACFKTVCLACFRLVYECEDLVGCMTSAHVLYDNLTEGAQANVKTRTTKMDGSGVQLALPPPT